MNHIVEKITALNQKQKELLAKQFIVFSQARLEACQCLIKGFSVEDVLIHIQTTIIPEQSYANYIVSTAQHIFLNNNYRLNYINYLKNKIDILETQKQKISSSKEKTVIVIYIILIAKELEFYNNEVPSVDLNLIDRKSLKIFSLGDSKITKIFYNSAQQQLTINLKLSWKGSAGIWVKGLIASLSWENAVILKNIFGNEQKYYNEIPDYATDIIWHEDELYIKIKPFINSTPIPKSSDNKAIKVISAISSVLTHNESPKETPVVENGRDRFLQANPVQKKSSLTPPQSIGVFDTNKIIDSSTGSDLESIEKKDSIQKKPDNIEDKLQLVKVDTTNVFLYTVRRGDSLEKIAHKKLGKKERWKDIYILNKDQLGKSNTIYPGQRLKVPGPK